jgi:ribosomal protein S18 acetylase RimI-like enzyme
MAFQIRPLRRGDMWQVLAIERRAFPEDPWTTTTCNGWLARSVVTRQPRCAASLARLIRLVRLKEAVSLARLALVTFLGRPACLGCLVAEADGAVAGFSILRAVRGGRADIQLIAVRADRQGEGIGRALLTHLIASADAQQCQEVFLYVRADNPRAQSLYRHAGFTETGALPGYFQPSGTDAIVMRLCLPRQAALGDRGASSSPAHT